MNELLAYLRARVKLLHQQLLFALKRIDAHPQSRLEDLAMLTVQVAEILLVDFFWVLEINMITKMALQEFLFFMIKTILIAIYFFTILIAY